jgi:putative transposase
MKKQVSTTNGKPYPVRLLLKVAEISSSAWYDTRPRIKTEDKRKRGPKTALSDNEILIKIKELLANPVFYGEGYIKLHKRLKARGVKTGKHRVYRIMHTNGLLNTQQGNPGSGRAHDGTIITEAPNQMWATDGKEFKTTTDGKCWFIGVVDHFNSEIKAFHICKTFDRFAAMESLRKAVKSEFGSVEQGICKGINLALRADHGSQFDSKDFQKEIKFLGLDYSPAFVRSPECNGVIERFHRTLNEQIFNWENLDNLEDAKEKISKFVDDYNNKWLLHRLKLTSPIEYRELYLQKKMAV